LETYASLIASAATMIAAMMTASNLGTRVTGWGFIVFTLGSVAWAVVGLSSGQTSLLITNVFLFSVNLFGVWRWLGRQARYEQGSAAATEGSLRHRHVPTLFSGGTLIGANVSDAEGKTLGTVIDTMLVCDTKQLSYIVIASGGVGGVGEALRALSPRYITVDPDGVRCTLTAHEVEALPSLNETEWPAVAPQAVAEVCSPRTTPVAAQV
jgi:sporulation protein YlmC with PRC-barrel domain